MLKNKSKLLFFILINFLQGQSIWLGSSNESDKNLLWHNNSNSIQISWEPIPNATSYEIAIGLSESFPTEVLNWTLFNQQNFNNSNILLREATINQNFFEGYDYYFFVRNASNINEQLPPLGPVKMDFISPKIGTLTLKQNDEIDNYAFTNSQKIRVECCNFSDLKPARGDSSGINSFEFEIINKILNQSVIDTFNFPDDISQCKIFNPDKNYFFNQNDKYFIQVKAIDQAGNSSQIVKSITFEYDDIPPISGFIHDINSKSTIYDDLDISTSEETLGAYWYDFVDENTGSGIKSYNFKLLDGNDNLIHEKILSNSESSYIISTEDNIELIDSMEYKIEIFAEDSALNRSDTSLSDGIIIDASGPTISSITPNNLQSYLYPNISNIITIKFSEKVFKPKMEDISVEYTQNENFISPNFNITQPFDTTTRIESFELELLPTLVSKDSIKITINNLTDINNLSETANYLIPVGILGDFNNDYIVNEDDIELFEKEWEKNSINADLGPEDCNFPLIKSKKNKILDIEDMKTFYKIFDYYKDD